jgi:hypothetical protein
VSRQIVSTGTLSAMMGSHACVVAGQSGVWVDGNVVEESEERLLVQDQVIDVGSKDLQLLNEVFPLLRAERYGTGREEDV